MLKIQTEQGNKVMWSRFPLYFDLELSSHSLIHIDRSRLREQTRALAGLSQSSIGQLRSNTIHMFYRRDVRGVVNAIKRQNPQHHRCSPIQWPSARRPSKTQLWHRMSDCSRKCFRRAVKCALGVRRPSVLEWPVQLQGRSNSSAEFGGPMGRDSSPGYSWLNLRQTAGTDED